MNTNNEYILTLTDEQLIENLTGLVSTGRGYIYSGDMLYVDGEEYALPSIHFDAQDGRFGLSRDMAEQIVNLAVEIQLIDNNACGYETALYRKYRNKWYGHIREESR